MSTPTLGSIILASTDPERLRTWYEQAFAVAPNPDGPGLRTVDGVATVEGNYPSTGASGERAAWIRDSEGNLLGIGQPMFD